MTETTGKPANELCFLDKTNVTFLQLNPLSELVDLGREPVCVPLVDGGGGDWLIQWTGPETKLLVCNGP